VLWWSIGVFFLYAGVASGLGTWTFTFLTQERELSQTTAGLVVTAYFIGFTASRLLLGVVSDRFAPTRLLRWSAVATVAGVAVFWWSQTIWMSATALVFAGFAHGPIFPLEMLLTAERFGPSQTAAVVGFEIAAANVGFALVPALIGVLVDRYGLATVPVALVASSLLVWAAIERLQASSAREAAIAVD
jgi:fucose permease